MRFYQFRPGILEMFLTRGERRTEAVAEKRFQPGVINDSAAA